MTTTLPTRSPSEASGSRPARATNGVFRVFEALAGPALLSIVLASRPVYAFAPPPAQPAPPAASKPAAKGPAAAPAKDKKGKTAGETPAKAKAGVAGDKRAGGKPGKGKAAAGKAASDAALKGKTVLDEEILIEGKLEKPSAYYILRRSSLDYDWARLTAEFSPLVLESVQDPLF
jgi:hypothetical protein